MSSSAFCLAEKPELDEITLERVLEELETMCYENMNIAIETEEGLGIEYDEDVVCDVCRSPEGEDGNEMVFCDKCNVCVHQVSPRGRGGRQVWAGPTSRCDALPWVSAIPAAPLPLSCCRPPLSFSGGFPACLWQSERSKWGLGQLAASRVPFLTFLVRNSS